MTRRTGWSLLVSGVVLLVTAGLLLPTLKRSNCGGNSAALAACKGYLAILQLWESEHGTNAIYQAQAGSDLQDHLKRLPGASWLGSARLLARLDGVRIDPSGAKEILMVCDRGYDNVPQRIFGRSPPAHAVAYSTGETGLISTREFAQMDLSGFIGLNDLANRAVDARPR